MSHEGIKQFLLCFQKGYCVKIALAITICWCLINFFVFIENRFKRLYHTTQRKRVNSYGVTQLML